MTKKPKRLHSTKTTIKTKLGAASASVDGYLTSADWTTFNNNVNATAVRLQTYTVSSPVGAITFTGLSGHKRYALAYYGLVPSSGNNGPSFRVRRASDATWLSSSIYKYLSVSAGSSAGSRDQTSSADFLFFTDYVNSFWNYFGLAIFENLNEATGTCVHIHQVMRGSNVFITEVHGFTTDSVAHDGIEVFLGVANITSGYCELWGL